MSDMSRQFFFISHAGEIPAAFNIIFCFTSTNSEMIALIGFFLNKTKHIPYVHI